MQRFLSERAKRVIFLTSWTAVVRSETKLDPEILKRLNSLVELVDNEQALDLPAHLSRVIWNDAEVRDIVTELKGEEQLQGPAMQDLIVHIERLAPKWIQYDPDRMTADLKTLIAHKHEVFVRT